MGVETTAHKAGNTSLADRFAVAQVEEDILELIAAVGEKFGDLAAYLKEELPESRELSLAQTNLETAFLYARRCVELNQDVL